eukprot:scaffold707_cov145-Isochrysis_galbana.AAC.1
MVSAEEPAGEAAGDCAGEAARQAAANSIGPSYTHGLLMSRALALAAPQPPPWGWGRGCHSNLPILPRGQPFPTPPSRAPPPAAAPPRPAKHATRDISRTYAAHPLPPLRHLPPKPGNPTLPPQVAPPLLTTPISSLRRASDRRLRWRHRAPAR